MGDAGFPKQVSAAAAQLRVAALRRKAQGATGEKAAAFLAEALGELSAAFKELSAAQDGLRSQSEARAAAELAAAAERDRYCDLFEFAPVGYFVTDAGGVITASNRSSRELLGFTANRHLLGKPLAGFVAAADRKAFHDQFASLLAGEPKWEQVLRLQPRPEGSEPRVVELFVVPFRDPETLKPMFRWQVRDVTQRVRAEEELKRLNDDLEGRVRARAAELETALAEKEAVEARLRAEDRRKDEFLGTLAHELREPLTPIRAAVRILQVNAPADADARAALDAIDRQALRLNRLADDLRDVSRLARGRLQLFAERVDLADATTRVAGEVADRAAERGLAITVDRPPESVCVVADPTRLDQVLFHLLDNAIKFTAAGGAIGVVVREKNGRAELQVRDTGIGIPADALPRVFDLFAPTDRPGDAPQFGLGVGLAMVRRLVELHGGAVEARSSGSGRGSEFVVRLPAADAVEVEPAPEPAVRAGVPAVAADAPLFGQAVAVLAHESRNALQRVHACLRMLRQDVADRPETVSLADRAGQALDGLARLFEDVRAASAGPTLRPEACDLGAVWREAWLRVAPAGRGGKLDEKAAGVELAVVADPFRLGQVFGNLFDNALAAGATTVRVCVGNAVVGGRPGVRVAVRDDAGGMPPEVRARLFEPFYTTKPHGTGLGLVVVKNIIEAHGGTVAAQDWRSGTEVVFTLPRSANT